MSDVERWVDEVRASISHPLPDRLTSDAEEEIRKRLAGYWHRIARAREAYETGELRPEGRERARGVAYAEVEPTPEEAAAIQEAFAMLAAMIGDLTARVFHAADYYVPLRELLQHAFEAFGRTISAFDPHRGASLVTWTHLDFASSLRTVTSELIRCGDTVSLSEEDENAWFDPPDVTDPDYERLLNLNEWALDFTSTDPGLRVVYLTLRGAD